MSDKNSVAGPEQASPASISGIVQCVSYAGGAAGRLSSRMSTDFSQWLLTGVLSGEVPTERWIV